MFHVLDALEALVDILTCKREERMEILGCLLWALGLLVLLGLFAGFVYLFGNTPS
jgi:hypothetical protein